MKKTGPGPALLGVWAAIGAACPGDAGLPAGSEGGPCYGNGTCDVGLLCIASVCTSHGDAGGEADGDAGGEADADAGRPYFYVLVEDQSTDPTGPTAGADIFGLSLVRGAAETFVTQVHEVEFGLGDTSAAMDVNVALGVPGDPSTACDPAAPGFVSLGGEGGALVVSFGTLEEVRSGDVIRVYACDRAVAEPYDVLVGTSTTVSSPEWFVCGTGLTGRADCTVPVLPVLPP